MAETRTKKINKKLAVAIAISVLGTVLSAYLWHVDVVNRQPYCPTNGCNAVLASDYSKLLGFPVAGWGVLFYLSLLAVATLRLLVQHEILKNLFRIQIMVGVIFTLYLRYLELFVLHDICLWCWGSVLLIAGLVTLSVLEWKSER
jgi:uncharacterized membrane protein